MTATVVTPTWVKKVYLPSTTTYGTTTTSGRLVEYIVKVTTAYDGDWIVASTYTPGTLIGATGYTLVTNGTIPTPSWTASGELLVINSTPVGVTYLVVRCIEA